MEDQPAREGAVTAVPIAPPVRRPGHRNRPGPTPLAPRPPAIRHVPRPHRGAHEHRRAGGRPLRALVRLLRPEQWIKNLLVFLAPVVAGAFRPGVLVPTAIGFVCFTAAASATYVVNDLVDREADQRHPRKRQRPLASGVVSPPTAAAVAAGLAAVAVALPLAIGGVGLAAAVASYLVVAALYNAGGKRLPHVEFVAIACFYVLRAVGGAAAAGVALPPALVVVLAATAVHLVSGKRYAELRDLGAARGTRPVLRRYTVRGLSAVRSVSALVAFAWYGWWTAGQSHASGVPWLALSVVPVGIGFLRYTALVEDGAGQRPERLVWADTPLLCCILCTIGPVALAMGAG